MLYTYTAQVYTHTHTRTHTHTVNIIHIYIYIYRLRWTAQQMNGSAFPAVSFTVFTVYVRAAVLPRDPPDFHFETGSDFMYSDAYIIVLLIYYCIYTLYGEKDKKRKSTVNRALTIYLYTYITHKYFVSKPSSVYICIMYICRLAYTILYI